MSRISTPHRICCHVVPAVLAAWLLTGAIPAAEPATVRRLPRAEMTFPDPLLGSKFRRFDAICDSFRKPGWHHRPYQTFDSFQARGVYFAEWASFADKNGRNPINYSGANEMHCVAMSAYFNADSIDPASQGQIVGMGMNAVWNPASSGWRTAVDYYTMHGANYPRSGRPMEKCDIRWNYHPEKGESPKPALAWSHGGESTYSSAATLGGKSGNANDVATLYLITVPSETQKPSLETLDGDIVKLLESPASLRDHLLARQGRLLTRVKAELSAGRGIENALRTDRLSPPANAPPDYTRSSRQLTPDERAAILATAVTELEAQSATIRRDFHALHAAVDMAFPLRDCLFHRNPNGNK